MSFANLLNANKRLTKYPLEVGKGTITTLTTTTITTDTINASDGLITLNDNVFISGDLYGVTEVISANGRFLGDVLIGGITGQDPSAQLHVIQSGTTNAFLVHDEVNDQTPFVINQSGNVGVGVTNPEYKLVIGGVDSNITTGPNQIFKTNVDDYPLISVVPYAHDDMSILFDASPDAKSSDVGSNFGIKKNGDKMKFIYDSGVTFAGSISWNNGLVLDTSGNVGINTDVPAQALDVNGNLRVRYANFYVDDSTLRLNCDHDVDNTTWIQFKKENAGSHGANDHLDIIHGTTSASVSCRGDNDLLLNVASTGNVGVGMGAPTARLHVLQTADSTVFRVDDATTDTTPFIIDHNGKVGIGTATPTQLLDINGGEVYISSDNQGLTFLGGARIYKKSGNGIKIIPHNDNNGIEFTNKDEDESWMQLRSGKIGIGTDTPLSKLHVVNVGVTDCFRVDDVASDTTPFIVAHDGKAGIGTATPLAAFHVINLGVTDCLRIDDEASDTSFFRIDENGLVDVNNTGVGVNMSIYDANEDAQLRLRSSESNAAKTQNIEFKGYGNSLSYLKHSIDASNFVTLDWEKSDGTKIWQSSTNGSPQYLQAYGDLGCTGSLYLKNSDSSKWELETGTTGLDFVYNDTVASTLSQLGGVRRKVDNFSTTQTLSGSNEIVFFDGLPGGGVTCSLPSIASYTGQQYLILNDDSAQNVVLAGDSGETINDSAYKTMSTGTQVLAINDGSTNWKAITLSLLAKNDLESQNEINELREEVRDLKEIVRTLMQKNSGIDVKDDDKDDEETPAGWF